LTRASHVALASPKRVQTHRSAPRPVAHDRMRARPAVQLKAGQTQEHAGGFCMAVRPTWNVRKRPLTVSLQFEMLYHFGRDGCNMMGARVVCNYEGGVSSIYTCFVDQWSTTFVRLPDAPFRHILPPQTCTSRTRAKPRPAQTLLLIPTTSSRQLGSHRPSLCTCTRHARHGPGQSPDQRKLCCSFPPPLLSS
jgi:hypothetical protein